MSESIEQLRKQIKKRQKDRVLSMQTGRELDALIAEYVMGYHIEEWSSEPGEEIDYWYRSNTSMHREEEEVERVPNYSTVFFSAEKILTKFKSWTIESDKEGHGISAVFSTKLTQNIDSRINGCETIPEAICKAALIALIENNRMMDKLLND